MLVDAGIDAINPVEPKAGMDVVALRRLYGKRLALIGGLDNAYVLPRGDRDEINAHVNHVLEAGQAGGLVLAAHSIGSDVSVATYDYLDRLMVARGRYPLQFRQYRPPWTERRWIHDSRRDDRLWGDIDITRPGPGGVSDPGDRRRRGGPRPRAARAVRARSAACNRSSAWTRCWPGRTWTAC